MVILHKNLENGQFLPATCNNYCCETEGKIQALVGAITFCGEYPGPWFEDRFRSANQMDGTSIADRGKMADS